MPDRRLHGTRRRGVACWEPGERTQRKPRFLFLFSGLFLFRFADRRFVGVFQFEPPRTTRLTRAGALATTKALYPAEGSQPTPDLPAHAVRKPEPVHHLAVVEPASLAGQPRGAISAPHRSRGPRPRSASPSRWSVRATSAACSA